MTLKEAAARLAKHDEARMWLEAAQVGDLLDLAAAAVVWVDAKRGWMLDDPDRRADPEDLALIRAVDALELDDEEGV